jgi:nucleoside-diphosphate-sugar epimerase
MKVLVLGGSGYVGARLCALLRDTAWATPICASRRSDLPGVQSMRLDTRDAQALRQALAEVDAVVNCVAGNASAIADGARVLARAALESGCRHVVHLSSMVVYGGVEGRIDEDSPLDGSLGWYAQAKCEAEAQVRAFAAQGGVATVLRPGCVWGPGSELWVGRIAHWLEAKRLGDLGAAGDGWSNLVHVDDVCRAVMAALQCKDAAAGLRAYNLAAPDSPRWNEYFVDLALAIGATPVRRLSRRRLRLDAMLAGPPLKLAELAARRMLGHARFVPVAMPPNLLGLWERHLQLDATKATRELGLAWTPYAPSVQQAASWWRRQRSGALADPDPMLQGGDSAG